MDTTLTKPVDFTFDEKKHAYFLEGRPMIGVTSVLSVINKPMLVQWSANMACDYMENCLIGHAKEFEKETGDELASVEYFVEDIMAWLKEARVAHRKKKEDAGTKGTEVHEIIEGIIKGAIEVAGGFVGELPPEAIEDHLQVKKFYEWAKDNNVQFLASELRLYSREFWYAGTADFVCMIKNRLYVGDVKTSGAVYPEHFIQASAYAKALEENHIYKNFDGVVIVNVPKKGGLNVKENYDLKGNFECFKAALTLHKYLNN